MKSEREKIQKAVDAALAGRDSLIVLEAGCGSLSHVSFPTGSRIVGIDISKGQLERNKGLDERIHGDIQTYDLAEGRFDAIVCWDVLEHVERPEAALSRFARAVREGGLIILSAPNPLSSKGIVTKLTPYWFHLWFYRNIRGWKEAGRDGNPPFPTYMSWKMTPGAIRKFAAENGLAILHESLYGRGDSVDVIGRKSAGVDIAMKVINFLFSVISLGSLQPKLTQYFYVIQKRPAGGAG
ncbi:MAG: class I SAM-dependent methyltransferase [bacterium]|jgi:SAM-dependent methyltransferase